MRIALFTTRSQYGNGAAGATDEKTGRKIANIGMRSMATAACSVILAGAAFVSAASAATAPVITNVVATPTATGATVTWTTDQNANSQVAYGQTSAYNASTSLDSNSVMTHSETIGGLTASTTYHFSVMSMNSSDQSAMSPDMTFTTTGSSGGGGGGTTDWTTIQNEIAALEARITQLENQIASILAGEGGGGEGGGGTGTTTPPVIGNPTIDQNGQSFNAGGTIDFGGRNFSYEQQVTVKLNGTVVATAHSDNGGNFTTGSLSLPTTPGTYTYVFTDGAGDNISATVTLH